MIQSVRALCWLLLLAGLLPLTATVWVSFSPDSFLTPPTVEWSLRWYRRFFADPRWTTAAGNSLIVAVTSAALCVTLATPVALSKSRWLPLVVLLPAVVPPVALGLGLLPLFHRVGLFGTTAGVVLAHTAIGLPVALLLLRTRRSPQLAECELAARGLGANRWLVFRRVTLPLLRPAILAAFVVQFVLSWSEALVTVFLTTPATETLPVVMWSQLRGSASPLVAVAAVLSALASLVAVAALARTAAGSRRRL